jgi:hypothetical protein
MALSDFQLDLIIKEYEKQESSDDDEDENENQMNFHLTKSLVWDFFHILIFIRVIS